MFNKQTTDPDQKPSSSKRRRPRRLKKWQLISLILLIVCGLIYFFFFRQKPADQNQQLPTFTAQISDLSEKISLSGNLKTVFLTEVNTKAEGVVKTVYVQNGEQVKQGDKLFEIELSPESKQKAQSLYNSYLNAQQSLANAKASLYSSQVTLFNKNQYFIDHAVAEDVAEGTPEYIMQESDWLAAEANYLNQEQAIKNAQQSVSASYLDYQQYQSVVVSPATGEVQGIAVTEGMMITNTDQSSQRLAVIKTGETLLVQLNVSELDIGKIKVGQSADITLVATGDQVFQGEVISIDQIGVTSNGSATYPVLVGFTASSDMTILPNMSADVDIRVSDQASVLTVSTLAVQKDEQGQHYVNLVTGEEGTGRQKTFTTERRDVKIGTQTENLTEIVSGLTEGETVQMSDFNALFQGNDFQNMVMMGGPGPMGGSSGGGGGQVRQVRVNAGESSSGPVGP